MTRRNFLFKLATACIFLVGIRDANAAGHGLKNATILIVRHAEKPDEGDGLTPAGEARAKAYAGYFKNFQFHSEPVKVDAVFAAADSKNSRRPRLTIEPVAQALGLAVNAGYKDKDFAQLADELRAHHEGKNILICWHHGEMPELLQALGADSNALIPGNKWPGDVYNWLIVLRYDANGNLVVSEREVEPF